MTKRDGGYEAGYEACDCFWGREPGSYVRQFAQLIGSCSGLRILDIGCGEGKNAAFLAERGARVTGIEISQRAIDHAKALHPNVTVEWVCEDAAEQNWRQELFDAVIVYGLFHCLSSQFEIEKLQKGLASATKSGGLHVVCSFNDRDHDLSAHPGFKPCLMPHEFYLRLYQDWIIEQVSDQNLYETHPHNGIPHHHSLTRILARKNS
jgi:tellurite methyltransferase